MDDVRRQRLIDLVAEAMALPPGARSGVIDRAGADDAELAVQARALVSAMEKAGSFMASPTVRVRSSGAAPGDSPPEPGAEPAEAPGALIGRYRLQQSIGEGGFGVVYMAEQRDPVVRQVALKIIRRGMDSASVVARFEQERQALAMMDHPGIARVLDGGVTASGRPYFVMELVRGDPIVRHCEKQRLGTRARLELFAHVCRAVQHAHTKGVIHRDIKPANVLVTMVDGRAMPKVIDFGIAKATGGRLTQRELFTEFRQMIGTPEYMSPEQADNSGVDVDARTDVYSLGVLLYELLTGVTPLDSRQLRSAAWGEMQRIIREVDPPRPSTRLLTLARTARGEAPWSGAREDEPARIAAVVRGDLDWIVMRCLEKDRSRRYETAEALAADLERHLTGQPVVAAPPSAAYRARKFVRRHRVGVAAAVIVVLALVAGMVGTAIGLVEARVARAEALGQARIAGEQAQRAEEEAARADRQAAEARSSARAAETVTQLMTAMIGRADRAKEQGRADVTVREVMDAASAELLEGAHGSDPRVAAMLARTIGETYWQLNLFEQAERMLRLHHRLTGEHFGMRSEPHAGSALLLGGLLKKRGEAEGAMEMYRFVRSLAPDLGDKGAEAAASAAVNESVIIGERGDLAGAEGLLREALGLLEEHDRGGSDVAITATNNLAAILFRQDRLAEAEQVYDRSVQMLRASGREPAVATALHNLAALRYAKGDREGAERATREELAVVRRLHGDRHLEVADALDQLAIILLGRDALGEATGALREGLAIRRSLLRSDHPTLTNTQRTLGSTLMETGEYEEAEEVLRSVCEVMAASTGPGEAEMVFARANLAWLMDRRGASAAAEAMLREVLAAAVSGLPDGSRYEWMRHRAACLLGGVLARRAGKATDAAERARHLHEAETLAVAGAERLLAGKERIGARMQRVYLPLTLREAVGALEVAQSLDPTPERAAALAAWQARLSGP